MRLAGGGIDELDDAGRPVVDETLLYLLNAGDGRIPFAFPTVESACRWKLVLDTTDDARHGSVYEPGATYELADRSVAVFVAVRQ